MTSWFQIIFGMWSFFLPIYEYSGQFQGQLTSRIYSPYKHLSCFAGTTYDQFPVPVSHKGIALLHSAVLNTSQSTSCTRVSRGAVDCPFLRARS